MNSGWAGGIHEKKRASTADERQGTAFENPEMKIAITGAGGLVGSNLAHRFARNHDVRALRHSDLDIADADAVRRCLAELKPALVINCALLEVDECERDPEKGRAVNCDGPRNLADAARRNGAEFVHFCTNYVFAGDRVGRAPYTIHDDPQPINAYGKFKLAGAEAVRRTSPRSYVIRTSWVYGRGKQSFLCTVPDDLRAGKRVRAIPDIWANTTYVADLADRIVAIMESGRYGTYHVVNEGICSYYEFALEAARLVGLSSAEVEPLIAVVKERDMKRIALRPRYTPLRCLLSEQLGLPPMHDWKSALAEYVREEIL